MNTLPRTVIEQAMQEALLCARQAQSFSEVPVGAVVLDAQGNVIGRGYNRRSVDDDPLAHAEVVAMRQAAQYKNSENYASIADVTNRGDYERGGNGENCGSSGERESDRGRCDHGSIENCTDNRDCGNSGYCENGEKEGNGWNLAECTLVVTLEPCPMCAGACLQTHIGRIVFGAWDAKLGACGSVWDIPRDPHVGAIPEVYGGIEEATCAALLRDFFSNKR